MSDENPYRELPVPTQAPAEPTYVAAWRRYRRLGALSSPFVLIPGLLLTPVIQQLLGGDASAGVIAMVFFVLWFYVFITARRRLLTFPCPRCGRRFQSLHTNEFDYCGHCHLRRFAAFDPDAKSELR